MLWHVFSSALYSISSFPIWVLARSTWFFFLYIMICDLLRCKKMQVPGWSVPFPSSPLWNRIPYLHSSRGNWKLISRKHDDDLREAPSLLSVRTEDALRVDVTLQSQCCLSWLSQSTSGWPPTPCSNYSSAYSRCTPSLSRPSPPPPPQTCLTPPPQSQPILHVYNPTLAGMSRHCVFHFQTNYVEFLHQETN